MRDKVLKNGEKHNNELRNKVFIHNDKHGYFYDIVTMELKSMDGYDKYKGYMTDDIGILKLDNKIPKDVLRYLFNGEVFIKSPKFNMYQRCLVEKADYAYNSRYAIPYLECIYKGKLYRLKSSADLFCSEYQLNGKKTYDLQFTPYCFAFYNGKLVLVLYDSIIEIDTDYGVPYGYSISNFKVLDSSIYNIKLPSSCDSFEFKDDDIMIDNVTFGYESFVLNSFVNHQVDIKVQGNSVDLLLLLSYKEVARNCKVVFNGKGPVRDGGMRELSNGARVIPFNDKKLFDYTGFYYALEDCTYIFDFLLLFGASYREFIIFESTAHCRIRYIVAFRDQMTLKVYENGDVIKSFDSGSLASYNIKYNIKIDKGINALKRCLLLGEIDDSYKEGITIKR